MSLRIFHILLNAASIFLFIHPLIFALMLAKEKQKQHGSQWRADSIIYGWSNVLNE